MKISGIVLAWLVCGVIAGGAVNADFRGTYPDLYSREAKARAGCARSLGFGLTFGPLSLLMSPFFTGFYQHGWTLTCKPVER